MHLVDTFIQYFILYIACIQAIYISVCFIMFIFRLSFLIMHIVAFVDCKYFKNFMHFKLFNCGCTSNRCNWIQYAILHFYCNATIVQSFFTNLLAIIKASPAEVQHKRSLQDWFCRFPLVTLVCHFSYYILFIPVPHKILVCQIKLYINEVLVSSLILTKTSLLYIYIQYI